MNKRTFTSSSRISLFLVALPTALLAGCATNNDNVGRAFVDAAVITVATVAEGAAYGNCDAITSGTAREACIARMRNAQQANRTSPPTASEGKFEDFTTYKAKRDAEPAQSQR